MGSLPLQPWGPVHPWGPTFRSGLHGLTYTSRS